jgi:hypothetical protein
MPSQPTAKSKPKLQPSFPLFPLLPPELRIQIWEAHLSLSYDERRIIPLSSTLTGYTTPLLAVNCEAYRTTLSWARHQGQRDGVRPRDRKPKTSSTHYHPRKFFRPSNPNRDVVFFLEDISATPWLIAPRPQQQAKTFKHIAIATHQLPQRASGTWLALFWLTFRPEVLFVALGTRESYMRLVRSFRYGCPVGHWFAREDWWNWDANAHSDRSLSLIPSENRTHTVVVGADVWDLKTRRFTRVGCRGRINGVDIDACAWDSAEWIFLDSPTMARSLIREKVSRFEVRYVY